MGVDVGLGGGKSEGSQTDPAASLLAGISQQFAGETEATRTGLISVFNQILQGQGSRVPVVSQAVESSRQAGAKATQGTETELARTGLLGTPFGARTMADTQQAAAQGVAGTESNFINQLFSMIPNFVLGQSQAALGGLGGAVGGNVSGKGKSTGFGTQFGIGGE